MFNILVIDDDNDVNDMVVCTLRGAGYLAEGATDGKYGMLMLKEKKFDLIVTDLIMPEKEGLETILSIRKTNKTVPIIAMSGGGKMGSETYLVMAEVFGANAVFQKPFQTGPFLDSIRKCLAKEPFVS